MPDTLYADGVGKPSCADLVAAHAAKYYCADAPAKLLDACVLSVTTAVYAARVAVDYETIAWKL
jgi:hypothetical protein